MKKHDEMIEVLKAFDEGKIIQVSDTEKTNERWVHATAPCWNFQRYVYRVKPEPLECWINVYETKEGCLVHSSSAEATEMADSSARRVAVHMREVED